MLAVQILNIVSVPARCIHGRIDHPAAGADPERRSRGVPVDSSPDSPPRRGQPGPWPSSSMVGESAITGHAHGARASGGPCTT